MRAFTDYRYALVACICPVNTGFVWKIASASTNQSFMTNVTIYFVHSSGKLMLSFNHTAKSISIILSHETHAHTHS